MTITTRHPASKYGVPVVLNDAGQPLEPTDGLRACMSRLDWANRTLAEKCGVSVRAVENWLQGRRTIPANVYLVLADALAVAN